MIAWLLFVSVSATGDRNGSHQYEHLIRQVVASDPSSPANGACKSIMGTYGYECEEHEVTTKDGYILSVQRIPVGLSPAYTGGSGTPILLQHGLFMDGLGWLLSSPDESLGYILADEGYDVWIANSRGTKHSIGHTLFSSDDPEYWDWSWDELAEYDLPATVEYVYGHTGKQKLHYVGHSLGTLMALASLCHSELQEMVRSAVLLSPIAYLNQIKPAFVRIGVESFMPEIFNRMRVHRFFPFGSFLNELLFKICWLPGISCLHLLTAYTGKNCCVSSSAAHRYLEHGPQPTATKNIIHLSQMIRRGTLTKFDYDDCDKNTKHYGQEVPPAYDISAFPRDLPLLLGYGGGDGLSDGGDGLRLLDGLRFHDQQNLTVLYRLDYGHDDFIMAVNAKQLVYDRVTAFLKLH
ncbi:hypothetical protein OPV22_010658 [Ensete ventricosum]|uniref:Lipase n=1 Tax=Ensete ventricosum TaxID=4639 RepID=A0AAV8RHW6_ENSVE|nr:hypothetical protein OPV22_010658 [Ensete ventricosum]